ncbi:3-oxoacyl-ACP synthase III family protein [Streptomyces sp. R28]|uniref:3-oxoacyl-ACP synthase III family protein n=1 Tax=Streptomyces sp. R28 TaxID=3238628 RepID=A0AB39Q6L8_9ACTN
MTRHLPFGIIGTGAYLPAHTLTNDEVAVHFGKPGQWVHDRTGIAGRRVAAPGETVTQMAAAAAEKALAAAGVPADRVALILATSSTPGQFAPGIACGVQGVLGAVRATAMDVNAACAGFSTAAHTALAFLSGDLTRGPVLVVAAERYSTHLDYTDRRTAALFGDGAGAVVMDAVPSSYGFLHSAIGSDGSKADYVRIVLHEGRSRDPYTVVMDGRSTRAFIEERLPRTLDEALAATGLSLGDIDLIVPHQANVHLVRRVLTEAGAAAGQIFMTGQDYGNTGAASVPITLDAAHAAGRLHDGACVLLTSIGAGMTWGTAILRWQGAAQASSAG